MLSGIKPTHAGIRTAYPGLKSALPGIEPAKRGMETAPNGIERGVAVIKLRNRPVLGDLNNRPLMIGPLPACYLIRAKT
jgi:hypothetical protein